tara:strand:- start:1109 stop:1285 length:177 start_codon:yes stop_codon:yes gene_type:complete
LFNKSSEKSRKKPKNDSASEESSEDAELEKQYELSKIECGKDVAPPMAVMVESDKRRF